MSETPPMGSYAAACAQLAVKHAFALTIWRDVDPEAATYRVNVRLGNNAGPYPHWAADFDLAHPIEPAVEHVASMAWRYFTSTGYALPVGGITERDIARTPPKLIVSLKPEREADEHRGHERRRR